MMYMDFDTGEIWTLEELEKAYNDSLYEYEYQIKNESFEDYLEEALLKGIRKEGGLIEDQ